MSKSKDVVGDVFFAMIVFLSGGFILLLLNSYVEFKERQKIDVPAYSIFKQAKEDCEKTIPRNQTCSFEYRYVPK